MTLTNLSEKHCKPCTGDEDPLKGSDLERMSESLPNGWKVVKDHHLEREYSFDDFQEALDFVNVIGEIAEEEDHHPDLELGWGRVQVQLRTHKIEGLSLNDFILAAKTEEAFQDF